jgi:translation initiation factor 6 (eIF-6)
MNDAAVLVDTPFDRPGDKNIPAAMALDLTGQRISPLVLAVIGTLLEKKGSLVIKNAAIEAPGESAKMFGFTLEDGTDDKHFFIVYGKCKTRIEIP